MSKVKICGLSRPVDIEGVNIAKPDYIGFVFAKSKRQVTPQHASMLRQNLCEGIVPVGVFVNERMDHIASLVHNGVIDAIQLHGEEDEEYIGKIKLLTNAPVIKAVPVMKAGDVKKWADSGADYLLLDKIGGGTGTSFDWNLIEETARPFFLAGGLHFGNIDEAVAKVNPFAVDISSGVETNGCKDNVKILSVVKKIREKKAQDA